MILVGVFLHGVGGFAAGSFYMAFKKVRNWSWESYWLVNGLFTWVLMPWAVALITVPQLKTVLRGAPLKSVLLTFLFGIFWGIGNLTFGLSLRYLGMSLGMALILGLTTILGTLIPPIVMGEFGEMISKASGLTTLSGIGICLLGIAACGWAGVSKERELSTEEKQKYIREFHFKKGLAVAFLSGVMNACFAFAVHAGKPIAELAVQYQTPDVWKNSAVMIIIMGGGFVTNAGSCIVMNLKNHSIHNYIQSGDASLFTNYLFCAIAGITGFMEFMFYGMGTTHMGRYDFASFSIHLAFVILFSTMWGLILREWKGSSRYTLRWLFCGLFLLVLSTVIMAIGNNLAT